MTSRAALIVVLLLSGCVTRVQIAPMACDKIDDVKGLRAELMRMKETHEYTLAHDYAKRASEKCAYDRTLGSRRWSTPPPEPPWYKRFWSWVRGQ